MAFVHFREPELEELIHDEEKSEQWKELARVLELEGQLKTHNGDVRGHIPYMPINKKWLKIFKTLCADKMDYKQYSHSTIPLDGLMEIGLCKEKGWFDLIQIWYDSRDKDPLIVGIVKGGYASENKHYLIGRFGDENIPLEQLEAKATKMLTDSYISNLEKARKNAEENVLSYLNDDRIHSVTTADGHTNLYW